MNAQIAKQQLRSAQLGRKRDEQIKQGAYDGRYCQRVVEDKKKKQNKYHCRGNTIGSPYSVPWSKKDYETYNEIKNSSY
jgi:hypothetical protein